MKRALRTLALVGCLVGLVAMPAAYAQDDSTSVPADQDTSSVPAAEAENDQQKLWFVELESPPAADGTSLSTLKQEKDAFRAEAERAGINFNEHYAFDTLWNGLSVEVDESRVSELSQLGEVRAVYPVLTVPVPEVKEPEGENLTLDTALAMTGADVAQNDLGYTGEGVKVGIIDSGIDLDHPDLGGDDDPDVDPLPTNRIVAGYDFVGDKFNADDPAAPIDPTPVPDRNPDDCAGHGTHVAGIVGANGEVTGVAPDVKFGAYKVFGCQGNSRSDVMIAAMEQALADGMDVVNMSIGTALTWPQYPTAEAADRLVNKGVSVVASIGNESRFGVYAASAPGIGDKVIGVAAFDNTHTNWSKFTISPDNKAIAYGQAVGASSAPTSNGLSMKRTGTSTSTADACNPLPANSLSGKAALIRLGGPSACTPYTKALNAQNAGAAAVVLYNNTPGTFLATVDRPNENSPKITIPVVTTSGSEGFEIDKRLSSGPVTMTWTDELISLPSPTDGLIRSTSSYGLTPELGLKPDIGAPGGLIRSTIPLEKGGHLLNAGTSMASPHVAGGVALLLEAKPNTSPQAVRDILQNSADPKRWNSDPKADLDNAHRQGAGMIDIDDAILSETKIEPGKLSLGESEVGPVTKTLTIENNDSSSVTYDLSHAPTRSTEGSTFAPSPTTGFASVVFSSPSVTVPAGGTATVDVTITANAALAARSQYGGYVVLTPQDGGQTYRVPYAGFKGDYQSIKVLAPTSFGFPWLTKLVKDEFGNDILVKQSNGATYTLSGSDFPYVLVHLDHQVRRLRVEVTDAQSGKSWHRALDEEYLTRNTTPNGFFFASWDGKTQNGNKVADVPDGTYKVTLSVQKALGGDDDPAHWEHWDSPPITIARP